MSVKDRKPKKAKQATPPKRGVSDKFKLVLVEVDSSGNEKTVPEDIERDPGKTYIFKQEAI